MNTLASGIILALILLACAILLRNMSLQPGETPRRNMQILVGILIAASLLTFAVTLATPLVRMMPHSVVAFVERVMPKQPVMRHPYKIQPTAESTSPRL